MLLAVDTSDDISNVSYHTTKVCTMERAKKEVERRGTGKESEEIPAHFLPQPLPRIQSVGGTQARAARRWACHPRRAPRTTL